MGTIKNVLGRLAEVAVSTPAKDAQVKRLMSKLRQIMGPGKTYSERGAHSMEFVGDKDNWQKIYDTLENSLGKPTFDKPYYNFKFPAGYGFLTLLAFNKNKNMVNIPYM